MPCRRVTPHSHGAKMLVFADEQSTKRSAAEGSRTLSKIASNTGARSPGEELMILSLIARLRAPPGLA
jgi:hypothetical protein